MKVLLQDQDDGMRALIRPMLAGHHVSVIEAKNAWDVPAMVVRHEPDVVLLSAADIYGPGRDVPDVLASRSGRPRLLLLGATEPRSAQVPRLPVDGYLPYPFEAERLLAAIDWVLQACAPRPAAVHAQSPLAAVGAMVAAAISSPNYFECRAAGARRIMVDHQSAIGITVAMVKHAARRRGPPVGNPWSG